jgi:hypothetical protein
LKANIINHFFTIFDKNIYDMSTEIESQDPNLQPQSSIFHKGKKATVSFFKKLFFILLAIIFIGIAGFFAWSNITYSSGSRAGVLITFNQEGYLFKTYEGELNLGGINALPGNTIANNMWKFSVKDADVATKLDTLQGKKVRLQYKEKAKNFFWQGQTNFFVDGVEVIP